MMFKFAAPFAFLFLLQFALTAQELEVGATAPDFNLKNIDDNMVSLASLEDVKGYIVIFTCNHCPVSIAYEDRIIALQKKYEPLGYPVVAINPNDPIQYPEDSFENMKVRAKEKGFNFLYLFDETQEVARAYGAKRTPHVYVLSKDRTVQFVGAIDDSRREANVSETYLSDAIDALISGKNPDPDYTIAIGCTIKWKKE